ncbi:MAG TPA: hypothetical protein VHP37_06950 [Burkholderiales bacterium]|nr:hypothetical protein [Burkholderiales bacterium]
MKEARRGVGLVLSCIFVAVALWGCGLGFRTYVCEDQINQAVAHASKTSYNTGRREGIRAALECFASRSGRIDQALEACARTVR